MKKVFTLIISLLISISVFGQFDGSGTWDDPYTVSTLTTSQTWSHSTDTVYVSGDLTVGSGGHLTINAGIFVLFTAVDLDLIITGTGYLTADGTSSDTITFTADFDDDHIHGEAGERWGHISFQSMGAASSSIIDYCIIEFGDVSGESAPGNFGGGLHIDFSDITVSNCILRNNTADWGGGIFINQDINPTINNCHVYNNIASDGGGGIYLWYDVYSVIENCIIEKNTCTSSSYGGGGLFVGPVTGTAKIINCIIVNNTAPSGDGSNVFFYGTESLALINTVVWDDNNSVYFNGAARSVNLINCAVERAYNSSGTIAITNFTNCIDLSSTNGDADGPNFTDPTTDDYTIEFISPMRDIGKDADTPSTDYAGKNRIGIADIGAYEIQYSRWTGATNTTWGTSTNWAESLDPTSSTGDVIIPSGLTNYPTASSPPNYTIGTGKNMILEPGAKVTLGSLVNNGDLTLRDDAYDLSSLIMNSTNVTADVELYLSGGEAGTGNYKWHYISSPFTSLDTSAFWTVTLNLAQYIESLCTSSTDQGWVAADGWIYKTSTTGGTKFNNLDPGKGYNFYDNVNNEITITGQLKISDVPVSLSFSDHGSSISGFNLLGNPFSSGLDWDQIVDSTHFDYPGNTSMGLYFTRDNVQCSYVAGVGSPANVNGIIPPMQGFFTKTYSTGNNITLPAAARVQNIHDRYKGETIIPLVRLSILQIVYSAAIVPPLTTKDTLSDETVVRFAEQAKPGLDNNFDAVKMFLSDNKLSIYSYTGETKYAINGLPFPETYTEIPIAVNIIEGGYNITISAIQLEGLDNYHVTLKDLVTGFDVDLKTADLIFTAPPGTYTDRFVLTITKQTTGLPDIFNPEPEKAFNIYSSRGILFINPAKDVWNGIRGDLRIYDITGKTVKHLQNIEWQKGVTKEISLSVAQGIYLVEICSATDRFVGRVSIVE